MIRLFLLYAILIFAKRAPKLISDLLKIKGDGIGLKGFNIKNKMGEAALVGDKVKKGMTGIEGGIKKAAGATGQMLKKGLINPKVTGNIKATIGGGLKDGWSKGKGLGKLSGALGGGAKGMKKSIWDDKGKNWKDFKSGAKENLIDNAGKNLKQTGATLLQGYSDYKDKKDTKGATLQGRLQVDPTYKTIGQKISSGFANAVNKANVAAGMLSAKDKANMKKRDLLGLEVNGSKVTVQDIYGKYKSDLEQAAVKAKDKIITTVDADGKEQHVVSDKVWSEFMKSEMFKGLSQEAQLTMKDMRLNAKMTDLNSLNEANQQIPSIMSSIQSAENSRQIQVQYTETAAREAKINDIIRMHVLGSHDSTISTIQSEIKNLESQLKIETDDTIRANLSSQIKTKQEELNTKVKAVSENYDINAEVASAKASNGGAAVLTEDEQQEVTSYVSAQTSATEQSITNAIEQMRQDLTAWTKTKDTILHAGYTYSDNNGVDREVDATNVLNALEAVREDIRKNSSDLTKAKEASNPKPADK